MQIVFAGDSVTDCGRRHDPDALGHGYVRRLAEGPLAGHTVRNVGVDASRVTDVAARWSTDVLADKPDVVSLMIGINDTWRRYDSDQLTPIADFERHYRALITSLDPRTVVVLMEPFVLPVTDEQTRWWDEDLAAKVDAVHRIADDHGAILVPTHHALAAAAIEHGCPALAADGVHPTPDGHQRIADLWWRTVGPTLS
ncbi:SGNH/GDSL hydrolase family protein [Cellulomonas sp. NPDC089187]|uniref:SGNH/GDSL hydrolase family protein n=1 Tax=Cellulomonas sp. NPDC089187 TaxID=3154970 RepID=UPI003431A642